MVLKIFFLYIPRILQVTIFYPMQSDHIGLSFAFVSQTQWVQANYGTDKGYVLVENEYAKISRHFITHTKHFKLR